MYICLYPVESQTIIRFLIAPPISYIICDTYCRNKGNAEKGIKVLIWGMFLHGTLNMILTLSAGYQKGYIEDIWGGSLTTTLQGMLLTPMAGLMYYGIKQLRTNKVRGCIYIAASIVSVVFSIITGRRTLILIFAGVLFINIVRSLYKARRFDSFVKMVGIIILILGIGAFLYSKDIFGIKTFFLQSNFYYRVFESDQTELGASRTAIHLYVIKHIGDYFFGGNAPIGIANYAHNLWLDVMVMCGVIPMILLIIFTYKTAKTALSLRSGNLKTLYVLAFLAINAAFFVEPVLSGAPHVFIMMCMMNGMIFGENIKARAKGDNDENYLAL